MWHCPCPPRHQRPARFEREQPPAAALDLDPFTSCRLRVQKGKQEQICQHSKKLQCHFYASNILQLLWKWSGRVSGVNKPTSFHSKTQRGSGAHVRTTKLVCILEGHKELSHLTSRTSQPIHFHAVALH